MKIHTIMVVWRGFSWLVLALLIGAIVHGSKAMACETDKGVFLHLGVAYDYKKVWGERQLASDFGLRGCIGRQSWLLDGNPCATYRHGSSVLEGFIFPGHDKVTTDYPGFMVEWKLL